MFPIYLSKKKFQREDTVLIMTGDNFDKLIKKYPYLLVEVTGDFCGEYCKKFSTEVTQVSIQLAKLKPRVNVARANISKTQIPDSLISTITRYPQLKFYHNGVLENYTGTSSVLGTIKWCLKKVMPPLTELNTLAEIYNFKNSHDTVVIYFGDDKNVLEYLTTFSKNDPNNFYAFANFESAFSTFNAKKNTVVIYRDKGEERTEFNGKISKEGLGRFINKYSVNKLMELTEENIKIIWEGKNPALFFFIDKYAKNYSNFERIFRIAADKLFGRIKVVITGVREKDEKDLLPIARVDINDLPAARIIDTSLQHRPVYN
ncbi:MAG: thioredoxin domain-containing protein, partial [archaeon]|nr:thioredoxin domain-containing protein [archaeon]